MSISDVSFLFLFLPVLLLIYIVKPQFQKYILVLVSLIFYACGSPIYFGLFIFLVIVNVLLGYLLGNYKKSKMGKLFLVVGLILNIGILFYYKYFDFMITTVNTVFSTSFACKNLLLPLGISFFVFKSISYLVDVYLGKVKPDKNPIYGILYLSFFGQIASGPICRYNEFYENYGGGGATRK